MTRHSTNDTELFRKMTSLILMGKISPPGHCHISNNQSRCQEHVPNLPEKGSQLEMLSPHDQFSPT